MAKTSFPRTIIGVGQKGTFAKTLFSPSAPLQGTFPEFTEEEIGEELRILKKIRTLPSPALMRAMTGMTSLELDRKIEDLERFLMKTQKMETSTFGDVTSESLMVEAKTAFGHLRCATEAMLSGDLGTAMDGFFKAAAIASNIAFTARTHGTEIPEEFLCKMEKLSACATHGIKKVMKAIVTKKLLKHESLFHDGAVPVPVAASLSATTETEIPEEILEIMKAKRRGSPFPEEFRQPEGPELFSHPDRIELFWYFVGKGVPREDMRVIPGGVLVSARSIGKANRAFERMQTPQAGVS